MRRVPALLFCLLLPLTSAAAGEKTAPTPAEAAAAALKAIEANDESTLKELATREKPDPWLVADHLLGLGEAEAAKAFASVTDSKRTGGLAAYLADPPADAAEHRARLAKAQAKQAAREWKGVLAVTRPADVEVVSVAASTLAFLRAQALVQDGKPAEAVVLFRRIAKKAEGMRWPIRVIDALGNGSVAAYRAGELKTAIALSNEMLPILDALGMEAVYARILSNLSGFHQGLGLAKECLPYAERALAIYKRLDDVSMVGTTALNLGGGHLLLGNVDEARRWFDVALDSAVKTDDRAARGRALTGRGLVYLRTGKIDEAFADMEAALVDGRATDDFETIRQSLLNLGTMHQMRAEYAEARARAEENLEVTKKAGNVLGNARARSNLALIQLITGDFANAVRNHERALKVFVRVGDRLSAARTRAFIGEVYRARRDLAAAIRAYEAAHAELVEIKARQTAIEVEATLGALYIHIGDPAEAERRLLSALAGAEDLGDPRLFANAMFNLALTRELLGKEEEALAMYARLRAEGEKHAIPGLVTQSLRAEGALLGSRGNTKRALEVLAKARAKTEELGEVELLAGIRNITGGILLESGRHAGALAEFQAALEVIGERPYAGERAAALEGLSRVALLRGDAAEALATARKGLALAQRMHQRLGEQEAVTTRDTQRGLANAALAAALATESPAEVVTTAEAIRAAVLLEALGAREALREAMPPELRTAEASARERLRQASEELGKASGARSLTRARAAREARTEAQSTYDAVVARIQREAMATAALVHPRIDDAATIRKRLAPDEAFVLYVFVDDQAAAVVLTRDGERLVSLGSHADIVIACDRLLLDRAPYVEPKVVAALAKRVIEPLALDAKVRRVTISPTGRLGYVPFALLLPDRTVRAVPSGSVEGVLAKAFPGRGEGVLALGNPDYTRRKLASLPATGAEARAVGDTVLLGKDASEAALAQALAGRPRWRAIHFACHGLVDPERPLRSALALSVDPQHDGMLTGVEILRMPMRADLVVLSACETGRGRIYATEGIVGLTRSFMFAGAQRVLCSLWKVDDQATRALMAKFYELWNPTSGKGLAAAAALKRAQAHVRSNPKWKHPYYWAAWVLWGLH